jgi:hypothetical protein
LVNKYDNGYASAQRKNRGSRNNPWFPKDVLLRHDKKSCAVCKPHEQNNIAMNDRGDSLKKIENPVTKTPAPFFRALEEFLFVMERKYMDSKMKCKYRLA